MTVPHEKYDAIKYAREFLYSLLDSKKTPRVSKEVRKRARGVLRHYPGEFCMEEARKNDSKSWGDGK